MRKESRKREIKKIRKESRKREIKKKEKQKKSETVILRKEIIILAHFCLMISGIFLLNEFLLCCLMNLNTSIVSRAGSCHL